VLSSDALEPPTAPGPAAYSLELLVRPASIKSSYTILSFNAPARSKEFQVRQWTDGLLVTHNAEVDRDRTRGIKFDVDHVFRLGQLALVTIVSGTNGTTVYLDGQAAGTFPRFRISRGELAGDIVLGTSPTTYHPWQGELRGLAIYAKSLTPAEAGQHYREWISPSGRPALDGAMVRFSFSEAAGQELQDEVPGGPKLEIPAKFSVPYKPFLRPATQEFRADRRFLVDVLMNIAGFIPLGLIFCAYLGWTHPRWRAVLIATFASGALSFLIEVLQYYIPRRASGTTDIVTNTLGACLGALLAQGSVVRAVLRKMKLVPVP
jgi:VanZ family protein